MYTSACTRVSRDRQGQALVIPEDQKMFFKWFKVKGFGLRGADVEGFC